MYVKKWLIWISGFLLAWNTFFSCSTYSLAKRTRKDLEIAEYKASLFRESDREALANVLVDMEQRIKEENAKSVKVQEKEKDTFIKDLLDILTLIP